MGRAFGHGNSPIRDHQGMPGPRELSFTAAPEAVSSRGHIPASMCLSTSCLSCHSSSTQLHSSFPIPSLSPCNRLSKSQTSPWQVVVQPGLLRPNLNFLHRSSQPGAASPGFSSSLGTSSSQLLAWGSNELPPFLAALPPFPPPLFSPARPHVLHSLSPVPLGCCHEGKWQLTSI